MSAWIDVTSGNYGPFRQGTDDAPTINKAIAAAIAQGGAQVMVGAGSFNIASPIQIPGNGVRLCGAGPGATGAVCTYAGSSDTVLIGAGTPQAPTANPDSSGIEDVGFWTPPDFKPASGQTLIRLLNGHECWVRRITVATSHSVGITLSTGPANIANQYIYRLQDLSFSGGAGVIACIQIGDNIGANALVQNTHLSHIEMDGSNQAPDATTGAQHGLLFVNASGVLGSDISMNAFAQEAFIVQPTAGCGVNYITLARVQCDTSLGNGAIIELGDPSATCDQINLTDFWSESSNGCGLVVGGGCGVSISGAGSSFGNNGQHGIWVRNDTRLAAPLVRITDARICDNSVGDPADWGKGAPAPNTYDGVHFDVAAAGSCVLNCIIGSDPRQSNSAWQRYGIYYGKLPVTVANNAYPPATNGPGNISGNTH